MNLTHILIFKTNISGENERLMVKQLFDSNPLVEEWSLDAEDVDCVLRVVSRHLNAEQLIKIINHSGFTCCELE